VKGPCLDETFHLNVVGISQKYVLYACAYPFFLSVTRLLYSIDLAFFLSFSVVRGSPSSLPHTWAYTNHSHHSRLPILLVCWQLALVNLKKKEEKRSKDT